MEPGRSRRRAEVVDIDLDVSWLVPPDLGAVDALARLQVAASRCGRSLQLHGACAGLPELLEFVGLGDVFHLCECCRPCVDGAST
jgi:hypothetical protein